MNRRLFERMTAGRNLAIALAVLCLATVFTHTSTADDTWPRFRGPNGAGQSDATGIPVEWDESDYLWKRALPGVGHSSPVVWHDRLFVTTADPQSAELIVLAFDAHTGEPVWERRFECGPYPMHAANSYATSTPAVDADALYVLWLDGHSVTVAALAHDGTELWQRKIGTLNEKHGFGTSPILVGDLVCVANETSDTNESEVVGLDRSTGDVRWQVQRPSGKTSYASPFVWQDASGSARVLTASMGSGLTAFDAVTGEVVWQAAEHDLPDRCVSSPILAAGLVLISCGSGNNGMHLIAVRPGAGGAPPAEVYRLRQGVPNIPTPVVADDLLFLWHDRGTVSCLDAATGQRHWIQRVSGNYHSSPVRIGERIYCVSLDGDVVVLAASEDFELLARNSLGEPCQATPAVAHNRLYLRTESSLICLGTP